MFEGIIAAKEGWLFKTPEERRKQKLDNALAEFDKLCAKYIPEYKADLEEHIEMIHAIEMSIHGKKFDAETFASAELRQHWYSGAIPAYAHLHLGVVSVGKIPSILGTIIAKKFDYSGNEAIGDADDKVNDLYYLARGLFKGTGYDLGDDGESIATDYAIDYKDSKPQSLKALGYNEASIEFMIEGASGFKKAFDLVLSHKEQIRKLIEEANDPKSEVRAQVDDVRVADYIAQALFRCGLYTISGGYLYLSAHILKHLKHCYK